MPSPEQPLTLLDLLTQNQVLTSDLLSQLGYQEGDQSSYRRLTVDISRLNKRFPPGVKIIRVGSGQEKEGILPIYKLVRD